MTCWQFRWMSAVIVNVSTWFLNRCMSFCGFKTCRSWCWFHCRPLLGWHSRLVSSLDPWSGHSFLVKPAHRTPRSLWHRLSLPCCWHSSTSCSSLYSSRKPCLWTRGWVVLGVQERMKHTGFFGMEACISPASCQRNALFLMSTFWMIASLEAKPSCGMFYLGTECFRPFFSSSFTGTLFRQRGQRS